MGFDLYEQVEPVNHDILINYNSDDYSPSKVVIYKDDSIYSELEFSGVFQVNLTETGRYKLVLPDRGIESGFYSIDKEAPILILKEKEVKTDKDINVFDYVKATDGGSDITSRVTYKEVVLNKKAKKYEISVSDYAGNVSSQNLIVTNPDASPSILFLQVVFILIMFIMIIGVYIYNKSIKLEKWISKFSISPLNETHLSLFDKINLFFNDLIKKVNNYSYKSAFLKKYSKRYTKYISTNNETNMDFVSIKFICSVACVIIALFAKTMQLKVFRFYDIYIPLVFGFFIPDLIYYFKYRSKRRKMENDLLQAIIIMNNAFKSGRSIVQAIEIVSNELDGAMSNEFRKMHVELSFGLGIEVVFKRFYERVKLEEVAYLTASLTILNKSGGNIVEVFSSIEKSLFNKKKLRLELASLTGGSKIIVNVLMIVPLAFILLIGFINPAYFAPLFQSNLGYIVIGMIFILYLTYIILVRRLMRLKI
jgi:tight adherence protein B